MKRQLFAVALSVLSLSAQSQVYLDPDAPIESRVQDALNRMTVQEKIKILHAQSKFTSAGVPRLGIRQLNMDDGPHGVREELEWNTWRAAGWTNDFIVAFPSLTCLAATWNTELSALYGHSVSEEFAFRGKDVMLGPGVNIQRTPLNGRAFEYMGEDPVLAGEMVVPYIRSAQQNGVACCLKHFVLNDQETDRFGVNVNVSERAMREIYLYPFEQAVERAHVWSIMGSYNLWQNIHCCHNDQLLNGILKREWQWDGALVSDWGGATNTEEAVFGGLDIEMGTFTDGKLKESEFTYDDYYLAKPFERLVLEGKVPESVLNEKAARVLRLIFRTAMNPRKVIGNQCSEAHYDACRRIGEEGIVLLKNEPLRQLARKEAILPLTSEKIEALAAAGRDKTKGAFSILVVGENATRSLTQGGGSSELKTLRDIAPLEALRSGLSGMGKQVTIDYAQGYESGRALYDKVDKVAPERQAKLKSEALEKARTADLIIYIGGLNKNHQQDCENGDRTSFDLSFGQNGLISELAAIQKNTIVVMFGGNPYATPWLSQVQALVHCWYLGSEAGTALVNVLTGKTCPSGKLPVTFAKRYEDYPYVKYGAEAYPGVKNTKDGQTVRGSQVYYKEDVFVGYRGFERDKKQPQFPFGYGMSYTTFRYGKPVANIVGDSVVVSVAVTNTGRVAGKEIAQVYLAAPKSKELEKPAKELKGFGKTRVLQPGESQQLRIAIPLSRLASWSEATHQWQTDGGTYTALVGASSADIRGKASFQWVKTLAD